jgi:hypothetical protein
MMNIKCRIIILALLTALNQEIVKAEVCIVKKNRSENAGILLLSGTSSIICYAVNDVNKDCYESTNHRLDVISSLGNIRKASVILPAVIGKNALVDQLIRMKKIDVDSIEGKWESYMVVPVKDPFPEYPTIKEALVVAGSDERGTMYGLYDVSEKLFGTDPQKYWTDAVPKKLKTVSWKSNVLIQGPPTFKYRGWFVNDEHGLLGWHHKKGTDNAITPGVWAKIFETICRMRGNFYTLIEYGMTPDSVSLQLANDRGLYVTGSHMHMLISNTSYGYDQEGRGSRKWTWEEYCERKYGRFYPYQWMTCSKEMASFWEDEGVKKHKDHLALWTIGLKGANDTDFHENDPKAPKTVEERAKITNNAIDVEKGIVEKYLPDTNPIYVMACRNDLFDQYRTGELKLPKNTIVLWPDDPSFGVIRLLPGKEDLARDNQHGIFFHLTFCDNHWVQWCPLQQVQRELVKSVKSGAVSMAEFNVGDIRELPLKISMAMNLSYDAKPWLKDSMHWQTYTDHWISKQYGIGQERVLTDLLKRYWDLEMSVRSMIILERMSQYTILDTSILKAIGGKQDKKGAMVDFVRTIQVPSGGRFGKLSEKELLLNLPQWNRLWKEACSLRRQVKSDRCSFYYDSFLLQIATSRLMNLWGSELFLAFDDIRATRFGSAAKHLERAKGYVRELSERRRESEHGKWKGWFNGDQLYPWTNQMWGFHYEKELKAESEMIDLLQSWTK